jgi:O-antigen ligase
VLESGYRGLVPGVDFRLHGLTTHANSLGPLAVVYLLLEYWKPSPLRWRLPTSAVAVAVLLLAQSKTAWVAAVAAGCVLYVVAARMDAGEEPARPRGLAMIAVPLLVVSVSALLTFVLLDPLPQLVRVIEDRIPGLSTLTGRDRVWEITLNEWKANPIFGYGPTLWDVEFRITRGLLATGHAHNQFLQTLGESGVLGVVALAAYMAVLLRYAAKHAVASKGVTLALVVVLIVRCITEAPFRLVAFLDPAFLTHLAVFALLIMLERSTPHRPKRISRSS